MNLKDQEELAKYRAQRAKKFKYNNKFSKEHYRRIVCMYPIDQAPLIDEAVEKTNSKSLSSYIANLIDADLKRLGLLS